MKQPLAIVGASTRSAAAAAVRAGFQPLAADLFADADLRQIATTTRVAPYPDGLVDWLRATEPPAWMYTGALENHPELVDEMAWIAPLWGNPGDVLARVRSPWKLASVLAGAALLFPETRAAHEGLAGDGSWLTKSYQGASGSGVRVWNEQPRTTSEKREEACCFQRRVDGTPCAAVYVATHGAAHFLGVTRQLIGEDWLGAHGFQYAGSIGPWPISDAATSTLIRLGNTLAAEFELVGLFGVDFMLAGDAVWTVEVNPRYTASVEIVERFSGVSALALHAGACGYRTNVQRAGASPPPAATAPGPAGSRSRAHAKAILFARCDIDVSRRFFDYAIAEAVRTPWPTLADVSPTGTPIAAGRPICTVFADGLTPGEARARLRDRATECEAIVYG